MNIIHADRWFWLAIFGLYFMSVLLTAIVVITVMGNRDVQYDALNRLIADHCLDSIPDGQKTQERIDTCNHWYGVQNDPRPVGK